MVEWFESIRADRIVATFAGLFAALAVASVWRGFTCWMWPGPKRQSELASLATWWVLTGLLAIAVAAGRSGVVALYGVASLLALREFRGLVRLRDPDRNGGWLMYLSVPLAYGAVYAGAVEWFRAVVPVVVLLTFSARLIVVEKTDGFLLTIGLRTWGVLTLVYLLGHAALVWTLPDDSNPVAGAGGWFLLLVLLTEGNDIGQALWGRSLGRRPLVPRLSPHKTWEGLVLGGLTTLGLSASLTPWLTPLDWRIGLAFGATIILGGITGDLNMSAVKRDLGVKDSSRLLPGQGGMLDRVDSLSFTAPMFYGLLMVLQTAR